MTTTNYDQFKVVELKKLLLDRGISLSDIKGTGKNGSVLKSDLIKVLESNYKEPKPSDKMSIEEFQNIFKKKYGVLPHQVAKTGVKSKRTLEKNTPTKTPILVQKLLDYLKKKGKATNKYWRLRYFTNERDRTLANIFFKGDYYLATLKAYSYLGGLDENRDYVLEIDIGEFMGRDDDDVTEEELYEYMQGVNEEDEINKIPSGGPFGDDTLWLEEVDGKPVVY